LFSHAHKEILMRKIEKDMLRAIQNRTNFYSSNTSVRRNNEFKRCEVFLFGNHIANVLDTGEVIPNLYTLSNWPTATTKSRLRALGLPIHQQRRTIFLDFAPVATC
jgi:hypothetical protein